MPQRILVPMDGSRSAHAALGHASLMQRANGATIYLLHVPESPQADEHLGAMVGVPPMAVTEEPDADHPRRMLEQAWQAHGNAEGRVEYRIEEGSPAAVIAEQAEALGIDCIVMGSRGLGHWEGLFAGSVSKKVAEMAPCPVITFHRSASSNA